MSQIEVRHVSLEYETGGGRVTALADVSVGVAQSEFLCVLGQSGCGKTTLLNLLAGFLAPTAGEIRIDGQPVRSLTLDRGVVFQDFAQLFPWRTARRNVEFGLEIRGVPAGERRAVATRFLELVKLGTFADAYPSQLSGGMQQRVAIARALAYNPAFLLMDEPFAALDAMTREEMQRLLVDVWQETRKTVVYVTHNVGEAVYLADRILVMAPHPGTVKAEIPVRIARPRDPLSAEFVEAQRQVLAHLGARARAVEAA